VEHYVLARCAVCGSLEVGDRPRHDESFVEAGEGIWVHVGECLSRWMAVDDEQRREWSVQAVRWREES